MLILEAYSYAYYIDATDAGVLIPDARQYGTLILEAYWFAYIRIPRLILAAIQRGCPYL